MQPSPNYFGLLGLMMMIIIIIIIIIITQVNVYGAVIMT